MEKIFSGKAGAKENSAQAAVNDNRTPTSAFVDKDRTYMITRMCKGTREIFENNPYCVLGISCNSSRNAALNTLSKLEKLHRLGATSTYNSVYDLVYIEKPNRELGNIHEAISRLDNIGYRWTWFLSENYSRLWNDPDIFDKSEDGKYRYDKFLACYVNALVTDPYFLNEEKWRHVISILDDYCNMSDTETYELLRERIGDNEKTKLDYRTIAGNFKKYIYQPLISNISCADGKSLLNAIVLLQDSKRYTNEVLTPVIENSVLRWVDISLSDLVSEIKRIESIKKLSQSTYSDASRVLPILHRLEDSFNCAEKISSKIGGLQSEVIMGKYANTIYDANIVLQNGNRHYDSYKYESLIYAYCNDYQKSEIKRVVPIEHLAIPDTEYTAEECKKISGKFYGRGDLENCFLWTMKAANMGDIESIYTIGKYYSNGTGCKKDENEAIIWFRKAADKGYPVAWGSLAELYYNNSSTSLENIGLAKECWIKAFLIDKSGGYDKKLDECFPSWRYRPHKLLRFSESEWRYKLKTLAEFDIVDAQYWYGVLLYKGKNGCREDKAAARRWMLKAALYDHRLAISDLAEYYGIDADEATTGIEMYELGVSYSKKTGSQENDLQFYWYKKAVINGHKGACNNLGVCYDDAIGVEQDYKEANYYYLEAIAHNDNKGALYNYGQSLYYGNGVEKDLAMAKEYLLRAIAAGSESAVKFLHDKYGTTDDVDDDDEDYSFADDDFEDIRIFSNDDINVDFGGFTVEDDEVCIKIWSKNNSDKIYKLWLRDLSVDDTIEDEYTIIRKSLPHELWEADLIPVPGVDLTTYYDIGFVVEIDDKDNKRLALSKKVNARIDFSEKEISVSTDDV